MFETYPLSIEGVCDVDESMVYEFVSFVITEGFCCGYDLANVGLSAVVSVEVKEGVEIFDLVDFESLILGDDGFGEYLFPLLFDDGFTVDATHRYIAK